MPVLWSPGVTFVPLSRVLLSYKETQQAFLVGVQSGLDTLFIGFPGFDKICKYAMVRYQCIKVILW